MKQVLPIRKRWSFSLTHGNTLHCVQTWIRNIWWYCYVLQLQIKARTALIKQNTLKKLPKIAQKKRQTQNDDNYYTTAASAAVAALSPTALLHNCYITAAAANDTRSMTTAAPTSTLLTVLLPPLPYCCCCSNFCCCRYILLISRILWFSLNHPLECVCVCERERPSLPCMTLSNRRSYHKAKLVFLCLH